MSNSLVQLRNKAKRRKPTFTQQDTHKKAKLKEVWRRPRGIDSKLRLNNRGHKKSPSKGYKSPAAVRGLSRSGHEQIMVSSFKDLEGINTKTQGIILSGSLSMKKRAEIAKQAEEKGITILNMKSPSTYVAQVKAIMDERKKVKSEHEKTKDAKKKDKERKAGDKEKKDKTSPTPDDLSAKIQDEEKRKEEKKEREKALIHSI